MKIIETTAVKNYAVEVILSKILKQIAKIFLNFRMSRIEEFLGFFAEIESVGRFAIIVTVCSPFFLCRITEQDTGRIN